MSALLQNLFYFLFQLVDFEVAAYDDSVFVYEDELRNASHSKGGYQWRGQALLVADDGAVERVAMQAALRRCGGGVETDVQEFHALMLEGGFELMKLAQQGARVAVP